MIVEGENERQETSCDHLVACSDTAKEHDIEEQAPDPRDNEGESVHSLKEAPSMEGIDSSGQALNPCMVETISPQMEIFSINIQEVSKEQPIDPTTCM